MRARILYLTGATAALAYLAHRSLAKVGEAIDEAFVFGDVICLPAEAQFGDARISRAGGDNASATDAQGMSRTHSSGGTSA